MPRLNFRPILAPDGKYAEWVSELQNANGAYVIKHAETGEVLYVGESHSSRLKDTLTRHFRAWNGPQAGPSYHADAMLVAIVLTPPRTAIAAQDNLIFRLKPADNIVVPEGTDGPADEPF
jgi:excinuclease UvrABC nuclease subunit